MKAPVLPALLMTLQAATLPASLFASFSAAPAYTLQADKAVVQSPEIAEASGMAVSPSDPSLIWIINDSGAGPEIHLTDIGGADRGKITLKDTQNIDWEDLAAFKLEGKPYLLVADTGDNAAKHETRVLYVVREPALPEAGKALALTVLPAWKIEYRYPGGPRDCESVAVDAAKGKTLLLSKRTTPPELYELPLAKPEKKGVLTATLLGTAEVKAPPSVILPFHNQPCGMDIAADRSAAAVVTYYGVFLFPRGPEESWTEAFAKKPVDLGPHHLGQAESIAFSPDGKTIYVTSEGRKSPLARFVKQAGE